ncbi:MAG: hypothetical protein QM770_08650 [Tepidisphaeraceae bacterium]
MKKPVGRPRRKPDGILGDRAYGTAREIAMVERRGIESFLAERSSTTHGSGRLRLRSGLGALRYIVERTLACFGHFRRLKLCYERWGSHFQAFHELAAGLLTYTRLRNSTLRF